MKIGYTTLHSRGDEIVEYWSKGCNGTVKNIREFISHGLPEECTETFFWGILRGTSLLLDKVPYIHFDHAYFGGGHKPPFAYYRVTKNALQNNTVIDRPYDRWDMFANKFKLSIHDWKLSGSHILILPPTPAIIAACKLHNWLEETINKLKQVTDRPIVIRKKPTEIDVMDTSTGIYPLYPVIDESARKTSLQQDLQDCWAVVSYNSMAAMDAVLSGIPAFVDKTHCLSTLGNIDLANIESPQYNNRLPVLNHLSYCQWSLDEMSSGEAYHHTLGS